MKLLLKNDGVLKFAIMLCLVTLAACSKSQSGAPKSSVYEVTGGSPERIARVSGILTKHKPLPTPLRDAHFVEEQTGDGVLGPSDFRAFCSIEVAPEDTAQWATLLTPLGAVAEYSTPGEPRDWWVTRDVFASLQFYKPDVLTGRAHGWVGISPQTGRIYIFTFTM